MICNDQFLRCLNKKEHLKKYALDKRFLQDENIFCHKNNTFIYIHYDEVISLLNNMNNITVKYHKLNDLCTQNLNLNILVSILPFILNTPRTSNIFIIIGSIIARFPITESPIKAARFSMFTYLIVLVCLVFYHFYRLLYSSRRNTRKKSQKNK
jgi:hypothetical protein